MVKGAVGRVSFIFRCMVSSFILTFSVFLLLTRIRLISWNFPTNSKAFLRLWNTFSIYIKQIILLLSPDSLYSCFGYFNVIVSVYIDNFTTFIRLMMGNYIVS